MVGDTYVLLSNPPIACLPSYPTPARTPSNSLPITFITTVGQAIAAMAPLVGIVALCAMLYLYVFLDSSEHS
jgi:hypothetical protein